MNNTDTIWVVIPYYQRDVEPLIRAISSVSSQVAVSLPRVIIIDDGSPCPAKEIARTHFPDKENITIVRQANTGASAARNEGLSAIPSDAEFVAFLDSDDEWQEDHLAQALAAMKNGCDFYFADHRRTDWKESKFARLQFDLTEHRCIDFQRGLFEFTGDLAVPILRDHLIQTSTVVVRHSVIRSLRFRSDLVIGEDELFWIQAIYASPRVCFSNRTDVLMGKGVNISQHDGVDIEKSMRLTRQNFTFWKKLPSLLKLDEKLILLRQHRLTRLGVGFAEDFLGCASHGRIGVAVKQAIPFTVVNPAWIGKAVQIVGRRILHRIGRVFG